MRKGGPSLMVGRRLVLPCCAQPHRAVQVPPELGGLIYAARELNRFLHAFLIYNCAWFGTTSAKRHASRAGHFPPPGAEPARAHLSRPAAIEPPVSHVRVPGLVGPWLTTVIVAAAASRAKGPSRGWTNAFCRRRPLAPFHRSLQPLMPCLSKPACDEIVSPGTSPRVAPLAAGTTNE